MMINPHVVLEGMGIMQIDSEEQWTFGQEDSYRVLTRTGRRADETNIC